MIKLERLRRSGFAPAAALGYRGRSPLITGAVLLCALLILGLSGCGNLPAPAVTPSPTAAQPTANAPTSIVPAPTATAEPSIPEATPHIGVDAVLSDLVVQPVPAVLPDYNRKDWRHWVDDDGDCQNARQEVLIAESTHPVTLERDNECRVESGRWIAPFTGVVETDPTQLDVDHMVPLANAHRSGGHAWPKGRKREYANDLANPAHLVAVTRSANRSKGSRGPEDWRPPDNSYWCQYAADWAGIKTEWGLTVTRQERDALAEMLATCSTGGQ